MRAAAAGRRPSVCVLEIQFSNLFYFLYMFTFVVLVTHTHTHDHIWMFISRMYIMNLAHMVIAVRLNLPTYADFINTREVNHVYDFLPVVVVAQMYLRFRKYIQF